MTTAVKKASTEEVYDFPPLTGSDRCDGTYTAQALVRLVRGCQDILLSAHYFNQSEAELLISGWTVYEDIREAVLNPPKTAFDTSDH
jgi:hypothetical protein